MNDEIGQRTSNFAVMSLQSQYINSLPTSIKHLDTIIVAAM